MTMKIDYIKEPNLRAFVELIRKESLSSIVVVGGAVRDLLQGRRQSDIDIAVCLAVDSPVLLQAPIATASEEHLVAWRESILSTARALGWSEEIFSTSIPFCSTTIDVLGLGRVFADDGYIYPDIFVDSEGYLFNSRPELTVNQMILDAEGRVGPESAINDLQNGLAKFREASDDIELRQLLRALKTCRDLNLILATEARTMMARHLERLRDRTRFMIELNQADSLQLTRNLIGNGSIDYEIDHHRILDALWEMLDGGFTDHEHGKEGRNDAQINLRRCSS